MLVHQRVERDDSLLKSSHVKILTIDCRLISWETYVFHQIASLESRSPSLEEMLCTARVNDIREDLKKGWRRHGRSWAGSPSAFPKLV